MTNDRTTSNIASPGGTRAAIAALAILGLIAAVASGPARAEDEDSLWRAHIDLGIDVSGVAKTPDGVRTFLVSLGAKTQGLVLNACENYMETPGAIIGPDTLKFCSIAVAR